MKISDMMSKPSGDTQPASSDVQKTLEQQKLTDQQGLGDILKQAIDQQGLGDTVKAEGSDVKKDTDAGTGGKEGHRPSFSGSCGRGHGCMGSSWCGRA